MVNTFNYKLIDKYYQNKCSEVEIKRVIKWLKRNSFNKRLDIIMNSQWNSIEDINEVDKEGFKKLIDLINMGNQ